MIVVVSIGGSVFTPDLEADQVAAHADVLTDLADDGMELGVVIGGGQVARDHIQIARDLGENEIALDAIGIAATRLNARLLIAALRKRATPSPAHTYEEAGKSLRRGEISVMGGVAPAQTTDAVSAALAEYVDADLLVYATSVSGVYDADPNRDPTATQFQSLTASELVDTIAHVEMTAGSSAPVDLLAAKVIQRSGMRTIVLDGNDPERVLTAVRYGEHDGTDIIPEGTGDELTYWAE